MSTKPSRRELFQVGFAASVAAIATGCAPVAQRVSRFERRNASREMPTVGSREERILNRVAFGARPGDVEFIRAQGLAAFLDRQMAGPEEDISLQMQVNRLDVFRGESYDLRDLPEAEVLKQLQQAAILRATYGKSQVKERMVDFWTNHFNIYGRKGLAAYRKGKDETEVIRKHALGTFPDLIKASATSPAMLAYLDNQRNVKGIANENYARELMELHTLGVEGGYTQQDVMEVARCFTGWTIETRFLRPRGKFRFDPDAHDDGEKVVLGRLIPAGGGQSDGLKVLDILAAHPSTAHFIATKMTRYFLGHTPEDVVAEVSAAYRKTGGDIRSMLRPILREDRLVEAPAIIKRPFDLVVSSIRAYDGVTDGGRPLQDHLEKMGQPLYQWPMPDGYPDRTSSWTGSMLPRWNFALALANNQIAGTRIERPESQNMLAGNVPTAGANDHEATMSRVVRLTSPEFQWR